jgi:hypothetical protein
MSKILLALPLLFFISCNLHPTSHNNDSQGLVFHDSIIDPEKIVQIKVTNGEDYDQILDGLDKNNLKSISVAVKLFQNAKVDSLSRDSMFVGFNDFFALMANGYLENNDSLHSKLKGDVPETTINRIKTTLSDYGMNLTTAEGEYYLEPETDWLIKHFDDKLSAAYRDYLTITAREQKEKFIDDGNILIPIETLMARIITWEDFTGKYPGFISINKAEDFYTQYLEAFLSGTENSKVFDPVSKKLNEKSKSAFEVYIQNNAGRKSAAIVKEYYELLKSSNFLYSEKVDSFILEKLYN